MGKDFIIHHNATTSPSNGIDADVGRFSLAKVQISGTSSNKQVKFLCSHDGKSYGEKEGYPEKGGAAATSTTVSGTELWEVDITGYSFFRVEVVSISGGNVTVQSKFL